MNSEFREFDAIANARQSVAGCAPGTVKRISLTGPAANRALRPASLPWFAAIKRHWWIVVLFTVACGAATYFVVKRSTPLYESTSIVEVDYQQPTGVIGQDSIRPLPSNDSDEFLDTQVKLITSDDVLRPVVVKHKLLELEKQVNGRDAQSDQRVQRAPIVLKRLRVSRQPSTVLLLISYRSPSPELSASVTNEIAESYVNRNFELRSKTSASLSHFMESQLEELKAKMNKSNEILARFEREMSVINPEQRTSVLSARLLQLSEEFTKAQAERMRKEASFEASQTGALEAAQVSTQGDILVKIDEKRVAARQTFASVAANLGRNHPDYQKAKAEVEELDKQFEETRTNIGKRIATDYGQSLSREKMLERQITGAKAEYDTANRNLFNYEQLKREATDDRVMYGELLRRVRESSINAGFRNHAIRVTESGRAAFKPVSPNIPVDVGLTLVLSAFLSSGVLIAFSVMDNTLRGERATSEQLKVQVLGALPAFAGLKKISLADRSHSMELLDKGISSRDDADGVAYEESIRKLRNTVDLATSVAEIRSVLVTSAMPGEGKSTIAADLSISLAQQQRRTLLIDADLRRSVLHERLGIANKVGLAEVLAGSAAWRAAIRPLQSTPNLFVMTSGQAVVSPADIVGPSFGHLIDDLRGQFDLIVVDAPPMLPFAEPIRIASCVDAVVLVAQSGKTTVEAAESVLSALDWAGAKLLGVILNRVPKSDERVNYEGRAYKRRILPKPVL